MKGQTAEKSAENTMTHTALNTIVDALMNRCGLRRTRHTFRASTWMQDHAWFSIAGFYEQRDVQQMRDQLLIACQPYDWREVRVTLHPACVMVQLQRRDITSNLCVGMPQ